jgi:hypothetical protein
MTTNLKKQSTHQSLSLVRQVVVMIVVFIANQHNIKRTHSIVEMIVVFIANQHNIHHRKLEEAKQSTQQS